jgi:precorrin-2 dehydrogenase/sirohydrochlorin ferrochelatase
MRYYPCLLDIKDKKCVVVGGGVIAYRKVKSLLKAGAQVYVVSPVLTAGLKRLYDKGLILWKKSFYLESFLEKARLVIAATDIKDVNAAISKDARARGVFANIVDVPILSDFIVPAVLDRYGFLITVSTDGKAPLASRRLKEDLSRRFLPQYRHAVKFSNAARQELKAKSLPLKKRRIFLNEVYRLFTRLNPDKSFSAKDARKIIKQLKNKHGILA